MKNIVLISLFGLFISAVFAQDDKKDKDTAEKPKEKSAKEKQRDFMATMSARSKAAKEQASKNKSAAMSKTKKYEPENSQPVCPITGNPL